MKGSLVVGRSLFVDGDTADPNRSLAANDTLAEAQAVGSPGLVGGYLGSVRGQADTADFYVVNLAAADVVTLRIADPGPGNPLPDFDLRLRDAGNAVVDSSVGTGPVEQVRAPTAGKFTIEVFTSTGAAGLYTLTLAPAPSAQAMLLAAREKLSLQWAFVPGEAIVKFKTGTAETPGLRRRLGIDRDLSAGSGGARRVVFQPSGAGITRGGGRGLDAASTIAAIKRLRGAAGVEYAEPNYIRRANAVAPNDPLFASQWHYAQLSLLDAWDRARGAGVTVAVLDTGVKKAHPDFVNADTSTQLLAGYDMISDFASAADGDGRDADPDDPGDRALGTESSWHGTHVAGTIGGATNNALGCAGVAPDARILPVRVLGVGGGTTDDIVQGILYAAGLPNATGVVPSRRADIINLSFGGPGLSRATADAISAARAAGAIIVASAGNDDVDAATYSPAAEPGVVTVGAVDRVKRRAWYSNFGAVIDLVAPGGDETVDLDGDGLADGVMSLIYGGGGAKLYAPYQGTSMASAHVSGVFALMKAANAAVSPVDIDAMIAAGAMTEDLGVAGKDDSFGYGLLNANRAVLAALEASANPPPPVPVLLVSSTTLDLGTFDDTITFDVSNAGRGALSVSSVTVDQPWVTVSPGGVGTNTVSVDRSGLAEGIHVATITVASNGGTSTITVRVTSPAPGAATGGDIGLVYVLVLDPATNAVVARAQTSPANGYKFEIADLPSGHYLIVAGTDLDADDIINNDGEAFGAFPVVSAPKIIYVAADTAGIDIPVRFQFNVRGAAMGG